MKRLLSSLVWLAAGAAALVTLGALSPASRPLLAALTEGVKGECVLDARAHAARWMVDRDDSVQPPSAADLLASTELTTEPTADLDGDGVADREVSRASGVKSSLRAVYLSNDGCMRFAGVVIGDELQPVAGSNRGVLDLEATSSTSCAGNDFHWARYRWDGHTYRRVDEADCELCEDDPQAERSLQANQHPHCQETLARRQAAR